MASESEIKREMVNDPIYAEPSLENLQSIIYPKREYHIYTSPPRDKIVSYEQVKIIREEICSAKSKFSDNQIALANYLNPDTLVRNLLIYWGTGVGKTGAAVAIAEGFKPMVDRYGTKIHILVPGSYGKHNFYNEILKWTGDTYLRHVEAQTAEELEKLKRYSIKLIKQYYTIMSYRQFHKKVLGEKISEKQLQGTKLKVAHKKTDTGEYERFHASDRIYSLNNTLLIVDEAHNITENERGIAIRKIIDSSKNLAKVFLTATPSKNFADEIVELINMLRPPHSQIDRNEIFTTRSFDTQFKNKDLFRKMVRGYVSYVRGADPITFAERVDMGEVSPGLNFTKVTRCFMFPFQLKTYTEVSRDQDALDKKSEAVANFVFPKLKGNNIIGTYGNQGIIDVIKQLETNKELFNRRIAETVLAEYHITDPSNLVILTRDRRISGEIFSEKYLKHFSTKFYTALREINDNVYGKKGPGLIFVYSNLVKVGVELFQQVMINNGYLEYQNNYSDYNIQDDTRCYFCGNIYAQHRNLKDIPSHKFRPATFLTIIGGKSGDQLEKVNEEKFEIIDKVYNHRDNVDGKNLKFILGSKVMNESVTLKNGAETHILDVHYTLGRLDQVNGRMIRYCVHQDVINDQNRFPQVRIYKYVISLENEMSSEENLYLRAEKKYMLIKETERVLQEEAFDCPINYNLNVFPDEVEKYHNCREGIDCPAVCGYLKCKFQCGDEVLNLKYYDPDRGIYRRIAKDNLDYSTYMKSYAIGEIEYAKNKIKEMFKFKNIFTIDEIVDYVHDSYPQSKKEFFDEFFVYQSLNILLPVTGNDFNNYKENFTDKFDRQGYLIYRDDYYIFQPLDQKEDVPLFYRSTYVEHDQLFKPIDVKSYLKNVKHLTISRKKQVERISDAYNDYYFTREEAETIGIINLVEKDGIITEKFNIRIKRPKILAKKRATGTPTYLGGLCETARSKNELIKLTKNIGIETESRNKTEICEEIRNRLHDLEKFSTGPNKKTYMIVPFEPSPNYPFPLNLEDRIAFIIKDLKLSPDKYQIKSKPTQGKYDDIAYMKYTIIFDPSVDETKILQLGGEKRKRLKLRLS